MTGSFCEVLLAVTICSLITIFLYIVSWCSSDEKEENSKQPVTSNMQGLENEEPARTSEPNERINYGPEHRYVTLEHRSSGDIVKEKSDLCRLQDEDLRSRIAENECGVRHTHPESNEHNDTTLPRKIERQMSVSQYDPVTHGDSKTGRLQLSIRYDNERSKLIIQVVDAEGLIRPEQMYAPEATLTLSLLNTDDTASDVDKQTRCVVENAPVQWKEPFTFCTTYENVSKRILNITVNNTTDPTALRAREVSIPLHDIGNDAEEKNDWFDLQYVKSS